MKWLIPTACIAVAGALFYRAIKYVPQSDPGQPLDDAAEQTNTLIDDMTVAAQKAYEAATGQSAPLVSDDVAMRNRKAFLDMIAYSEGTYNAGDAGYLMMFGGRLADSLEVHPRQLFSFTNSRGEKLKTTAAGRYQFLAKTWDALAARLGLPDFGPSSQDAAALELVRERGALPDVDAGRVQVAITKCSKIWASLPGAGYAQPERKLADLTAAFANAGGLIVGA